LWGRRLGKEIQKYFYCIFYTILTNTIYFISQEIFIVVSGGSLPTGSLFSSCDEEFSQFSFNFQDSHTCNL